MKPRPVVTPTILQFEVSECALAALAMLLGHQGCAVGLEELRQAAGVSRDGMPLPRLRALAGHYGYRLRVFRRELDDLRRVPLPAMVFLNFNHMVVVEAADDRGLQINDPAGGPRPMTWDEMDRAFSGLVLTLEPGTLARRQPSQAVPWPLPWPAPWTLAALTALFGATAQALAVVSAGAAQAGYLAAAALGLVATLAALLWGRDQLRRRGRDWAWRRLAAQGPAYLVHRSAAVRLSLLAAPGALADLCGGAAGHSLLALLAGLPPLAGLAWRAPWAAALVGAALLALGLAQRHLHLHRRSPWRRAQSQGQTEGVLGPHELAVLETLQLSGHDEDALIRQCGAIARGSEASHDGNRVAAIGHALTLGVAAALLAATAMLSPAAERWANLALTALVLAPWLWLDDLFQARLALPALHAALADLAAPPLAADGVRPLPIVGRLALVNLSFGYGQLTAPLFDQLNLDVAPGHCLGVAGPPGSGKTTLGKLLAGNLTPRSGLVAAGGPVLRVGSEPLLFAGSVADNLRLWQEGFADAELDDALALAGLTAEVAARGGLAATVEEGGHNWSGGQRRRLMLARALLRRPAILVIDETLDGVDQDKEAEILRRLRQRHITVVLISQRRLSLAHCDERLWLGAADQGAESPAANDPTEANSASAAQPPLPAEPVDPAVDDPLAQPLTAAARAALAGAAARLGVTLPALPDHATLSSAAARAGLMLRPLALGGEPLPADPGLPLLVLDEDGWRHLPPGSHVQSSLDSSARYYGVHPRHGAARLATAQEAWGALAAAIAQWGGWLLVAWLLAAPSLPGLLAAVIAVALGSACRQRIATRWDLLLALSHGAKTWHRALGWSAHWVHQRPLGLLATAVAGDTNLARQQPPRRQQRLVDALALTAALALLGIQAAPWPGLLLPWLLTVLVAQAALERREQQARDEGEDARIGAKRFLRLVVGGLAEFRALGAATSLHQQWLARSAAADRADTWRQACLLGRRALRLFAPLAAALLVTTSPTATASLAALAALAAVAAGQLGENLGALAENRRQARRWAAVLNGPDEAGPQSAPPGRQTLTLRDVHFAYDGRPVLEGINLSLAPGEVVALTAPTGSGKTTLLRLLLGFYPPQRGCVTYGGQSLTDLDRRALRRDWGAVQQDETLPAGLLRQVLGGLHPGATRRAWHAAAQVNLAADIAAMAMGMASPSHADLLSTGQQQKLLLGRALARLPRLLVLDEALSALDDASRRQVLAAVRAQGASCVVVTHDPDTLALCDRQWLLRKGRLETRATQSASADSDVAPRDAMTDAVTEAATTAPTMPPALADPDADHPLYRRRALALADSGARLDQAPRLPPWPALALASLLLGVLHG
ncbi:hypothetical protein DLREEDagrD3_11560 [Denitratisoma sp. agr-D3]